MARKLSQYHCLICVFILSPLAICFYQVSKYLTKSLMVAKVRLKVGICWNPSLTRKAGMQG